MTQPDSSQHRKTIGRRLKGALESFDMIDRMIASGQTSFDDYEGVRHPVRE